MSKAELRECAEIALGECLNLSRNEQLLILCDPPCYTIGSAFRDIGVKRCKEAVMVQISPRKEHGNEPPMPVDQWLSQFDVAVLPTSKSLTNTRARMAACRKGTRIASLPGITEEVFIRTMKTDWKRLGRYTRSIAARLSSVKKIQITSEAGTDLVFETGGRHAKADDGAITSKGASGNLPAGKACLAPLEGTAEGKIVFEGSFSLIGPLNKPFALQVKSGKICRVFEHECSNYLRRIFNKYGGDARTIAEFGIGTLDTATVSGNILEDEKAKGTAHVALGDNISIGGNVNVPIHLGGRILGPTVRLDGRVWMEKGTIIGG